MISPGKIAVLALAVGLAFGIYFFGDFVGPQTPPEKPDNSSSTFEFAEYKKRVLEQHGTDFANVIAGVETKIAESQTDSAKVSLLNQLIAFCEQENAHLMAAHYSAEIAEIRADAANWEKTGDDYMSVFYDFKMAPEAQSYVVGQARQSYQKSLAIDSTTGTLIKLATTYLDGPADGTTMPMQGVGILLGIVAKDSTNIDAQLTLGRYGIISGQYDKAVNRLNAVLALDPENTQAYFFLGEAYLAQGDKTKAIEYFLKCKELVNDPEFQKQLDTYIEQIKNS